MSNDERTSLYRFFDREGSLLYVGITNHLPRRFWRHDTSQEWWDDVAHVAVEHFENRRSATEAELRAIKSEGPRHNIRDKPRPPSVKPSRTAGHGAGAARLVEVGHAMIPPELRAQLDRDEWLRLDQVARLAGVGRTTLNDWIKQGRVKVRYRKTLGGGQRRFNPEDVRRIIVEVKEEHSAEADD